MKKSKEKKKRGFFRIVFGTIAALISLVILSAAGLGIYLYLNMKNDPVTVNSLEEYIKAPADTEFRHLSFSRQAPATRWSCLFRLRNKYAEVPYYSLPK